MSSFAIKTPMVKLAVDKSFLKEHSSKDDSRVVYMNDGQEFQIQLFNPNQFTVGAEISINGDIERGLIVLRPGERAWLERYISKNRKLRFSTYEVEDSDEAKNAIAKNGEIKISFYKERIPINDFSYVTYTTPINWNTEWNTVCDNVAFNNINSVTCATNTAEYSAANTASSIASSIATSCAYCASGSAVSDANGNRQRSASPTQISASIETGRISAGSASSQNFNTVDTKFEYTPFEIETIKILPMSRKPINQNELKKIYCTNCGRKLNTKFKFCPYCGAKCI